MAQEMKSTIFDLVICLSNVVDLVSPALVDHHKRVAYLAYKIGTELGLTAGQRRELALAGALHDVGALSLAQRMTLLEFEATHAQEHSDTGYLLLNMFEPFTSAAHIIRFHHVPWDEGRGEEFQGKEVPLGSHIIHLADRVAVLIDKEQEILGQAKGIVKRIQEQSGKMFIPQVVEAFQDLSSKEIFWLDASSLTLGSILSREVMLGSVELDIPTLRGLARMFHRIIDFRCPFTATHSHGVAATAKGLAGYAGFSQRECQMMEVAGFLHDLGKLAVASEILEKPNQLSPEEFNVIKKHSFHTYRSLQTLGDLDTINTWASFHHERLDGGGYPFHFAGSDLPLGSRIVAVADVFTALTEDRPYRQGMSGENALKVIQLMADKKALDHDIVALLRINADEINGLRIAAQTASKEEYHLIEKSPYL